MSDIDPGDAGNGVGAVTDSSTGQLVRSSGIVALGTGLSRVTGLARTFVTLYALGWVGVGNVYTLANTTPNLLYDLLLGGILTATLVPVLVDRVNKDDPEGTDAVVTVVTVGLVILTLVAVLAAPLIIHLYSLATSDPRVIEQNELAIPLLRLFIPQILFYGLTALGAALLNAHKRFAAAAFAPVANNVVVIGVLLAVPRIAGGVPTIDQVRSDTGLLLLLGLGTTLGIVTMAAVLWPAIRRAGIRLHWRFDLQNPAVRTVVRLSGWTLGYVVTNQVAFFVVTALAWRAQNGAVTVYQTAYVFFQFPYGLFAVSVMTAFLPELSRLAERGDDAGFSNRFLLGLRLTVLIILPASIGLVLLARPALALLQHGGFDQRGVELTAHTMAGFAIGLLGFSTFLYAMRGFYAFKDTKTPFLLGLIQNAINVVLAFVLVDRYQVEGLAWSFSVSYLIGAVVALGVLRRKVGALRWGPTAGAVVRILIACAVMSVAVWAAVTTIGSDEGAGALARTAVGVTIGGVVYLGALLLLRVPDVDEFRRRVLARRAT